MSKCIILLIILLLITVLILLCYKSKVNKKIAFCFLIDDNKFRS